MDNIVSIGDSRFMDFNNKILGVDNLDHYVDICNFYPFINNNHNSFIDLDVKLWDDKSFNVKPLYLNY